MKRFLRRNRRRTFARQRFAYWCIVDRKREDARWRTYVTDVNVHRGEITITPGTA